MHLTTHVPLSSRSANQLKHEQTNDIIPSLQLPLLWLRGMLRVLDHVIQALSTMTKHYMTHALIVVYHRSGIILHTNLQADAGLSSGVCAWHTQNEHDSSPSMSSSRQIKFLTSLIRGPTSALL